MMDRMSVAALLDCDAVLALPGWEFSNGANAEADVARWARMPIYDLYADGYPAP